MLMPQRCWETRKAIRCRANSGRMDSYGDIVDAYIRDWRVPAQRERRFFKSCTSTSWSNERSAASSVIGRLTVYDVTTRIAAHLGLTPECVYMHAGTAVGAKALGLEATKTIGPMELPEAFRRLRPYEIEDCLCLYKRQLLEIARQH